MLPTTLVGRFGCVLAISLLAATLVQHPASAGPVQLPQGATAVFQGTGPADGNGNALAAAGDFNSDGRSDVIRGAPEADPHAFTNAGAAAVAFGEIKSLPYANTQTWIYRAAAGDGAGESVGGAGDVNGDGIDDVIVGAPGASPGGRAAAGSSYVVFGAATPGLTSCMCIELSTLPPARGFRIDGAVAGDNSGTGVAGAGDVNGDGYDDVIIGAPSADPGGRAAAGSSYVVFGSATTANVSLATLTAVQGFRVDGAVAGDDSGRVVDGAGDVDGDGRDDLVIGARLVTVGPPFTGAAYVIRGSAAPTDVHLGTLTPAVGFRIAGANAFDVIANAVAGAGDVNGDGFDDVIVGANNADPGGLAAAGSSYVVFGSATLSNLALGSLTAARGFRIDGAAAGDDNGHAVDGAGDVNGDGRDDVFVSSRLADPGGVNAVGSSYVVWGSASPANVGLGTLTPAQGFRIDGDPAFQGSGFAVAGVGNVAGDGRADLAMSGADTMSIISGTFLPAIAYESTVTLPLGKAARIAPTGLKSAGARTLAITPALPAGLSFSATTGLVTGTPTAVGFSTHEITLTDANGRTSTKLRLAVVNTTPPAPPATKPTAPKIGTASSGAAGGTVNAVARWAAPTSTGGSAITSYRVYAYKLTSTGGISKTSFTTRPASSRSYTWALPAGRYKFRVVAYNKVGASPYSAYSNIVQSR